METEQLRNLSKVTHSCAMPFLPFVQGWQPPREQGWGEMVIRGPVPIFHASLKMLRASFESLHLPVGLRSPGHFVHLSNKRTTCDFSEYT